VLILLNVCSIAEGNYNQIESPSPPLKENGTPSSSKLSCVSLYSFILLSSSISLVMSHGHICRFCRRHQYRCRRRRRHHHHHFYLFI
jgi:hypothetical protein